MRKIIFIFLAIASFLNAYPQKINSSISVSAERPLGSLSGTHLFGMHAEGIFNASPDSSSHRIFHFIYKAGAGYYFGANRNTSGYHYKYPAYTIVYTAAGVSFDLLNNVSGTLMAGPALGLYNKTKRFNAVADLNIVYNISAKISAGPDLRLIKEFGADALWTAGLRVIYRL